MNKARMTLIVRLCAVGSVLLIALIGACPALANDDIRRQIYELANPSQSRTNQPINHGKLNSFQDYQQENEVELQYVSSMFWGRFLGIEVVGPYAYCIIYNGMVILDVTDPVSPTLISNCYLREGPPTSIVIDEDKAYIFGSTGALYIIDISDVYAPIIINTNMITPQLYSGDVSGHIAAVSYTFVHDPTGILIYDLSDPSDIRIIDDIPTQFAPFRVSIQGDSLLYATESVYLNVYNIATVPAVKIAEFSLGMFLANDIFISDTLVALSTQEAFWPTYESKTFVFNMANASDPQLIFDYKMAGHMIDVQLSDSLLYVALASFGQSKGATFGLKVFDFTKDDSVSFLNEFITGGVSGKITLIDTLMYMATFPIANNAKSESSSMPMEAEFEGGELLITDISDLSDIKYVGGFKSDQRVTGIDVIENTAYVLNDEFPGPGVRIRMADISNINEPYALGSYDTYGPAQSVHKINDTVVGLTAGGDGFQFINVADRQTPTLIGAIAEGVSTRDAMVLGDYLYIANHTSGLWVWDISDILNPKFVDSVTIPGQSISLAKHNSYLYIALVFSGIAIVDISNPDNPILIGTFETDKTCSQVICANGILFSLHYAGIRIYDLAFPEAPEFMEIFFNSDSRKMTIEGDNIFVASGWAGVHAISISDPHNPFLAGYYNTPGYSEGIDSDGMNIYVADSYSWITLRHSIITDIEDNPLIVPNQFVLNQNYPNPFNPSTTIEYTLGKRNQVTIDIFNINGQKVKTLLNDIKPAGRHSIVWDGTDLKGKRVASGIYIYKAQIGDLVQSRSMILLK